MAVDRKLKRQLNALIERFTPDIRDAFFAAVVDITDRAAIQAITDAIVAGDLERAFRATGMSPAAMRPLSSMIERAFETGGVTVARSFPVQMADAGASIIHFDVHNSRAEAWLRDHSSQLVTRITEDVRANIQTIVSDGMLAGRNPRNIALDIIGRVGQDGRREGGIVGLTNQQTKWVSNARTELTGVPPDENYFTRVQRDKRFDSVVRKAINEGRGLKPGEVDAITGKYSDNLLQLRGETIARTEAMTALAKSQDEAIRQAIDNGTLNPRHVKKVWDATMDKRTRPSHVHMDGQRVGMDDAFTTPDGAKLMYPLDTSLGAPASETINCRCRVDYDVDWLADVADDPEINWDEWGDDNPPAPVPPVPPAPPSPPPAPTPPPAPVVPRMAYEEYVPVRNLAEAEAWSRENIAQTVHFTKGAKMDGLNAILQASLEVINRFNLPKMRYMGDPKQDDRKWKMNPKAVATFGMQSDTFLFRNLAPDNAKVMESMAGNDAQSVRNLEIARANRAAWIAPAVREGLERMEKIEWAVSKNSQQVTYHEMGHRLHGHKMAEITAIMRGENWITEGWPYLISRYSATNIKEYVAETFSLYMQGDESQFYRIHPRLLAYYKSQDRKNVRT